MLVMSEELDLSFLTPDEAAQLRSVLERAKLLDEVHEKQRKEGASEISSDDVIRSRWNEKHKEKQGSYQPAITVLTAALDVGSVDEPKHVEETLEPDPQVALTNDGNDDVEIKDDAGKINDAVKESTLPDIVPSPDCQKEEEEEAATAENHIVDDSIRGSPDFPPSPTYEKPETKIDETLVNEIHRNGDVTATELENNNIKVNKKSPPEEPEIISLGSSVQSNEMQEGTNHLDDHENKEEKDQLSPLPVGLGSESPSKENSSFREEETTSMLSRSSHANEFVGEVEIALTYYPPSCEKHTTFPQKGTRFAENKNLDVLTRKAYVNMTGGKLQLAKDSKSGATKENEGELHLSVKGANDLNLPSLMRHKARTYAKCYLLPDRFHGSKMRSEVVKDTLQPRYDHKFVFRGFAETEFEERSIELVIGGVTSTRGRHIVVGGIRLSNGEHGKSGTHLPWKDSNVEEIRIWKRAFTEPTVEVRSTIRLRPHIKLTYK